MPRKKNVSGNHNQNLQQKVTGRVRITKNHSTKRTRVINGKAVHNPVPGRGGRNK